MAGFYAVGQRNRDAGSLRCAGDFPEDVIAIGDNYNDLPMLAEVGHPWIMKNSALDQAGFGQSHEFLRAESVEEILKKL